jgi:membrane-associated phospholipid phosphatase
VTRTGHAGSESFALLQARRGSAPERFATSLDGRHPAAVFFAALLAGFAVLAIGAVLLGLFVTHVLLHAGGVASGDESVVESIVHDRSGTLTDVSWVGTFLGGAPWLPALVALIAIFCAVKRYWRVAAFVVFALAVESATYRVTSLAAPRQRPTVHRLENLPADASFPSGHTAASIAVYIGLALLITSRFHSRGARIAAWTVALLMPPFVALSRMYRGMHHPIDVAGGLLIGIGALLVLLFATRAAGVAEAARSPEPSRSRRSSRARDPQPVV